MGAKGNIVIASEISLLNEKQVAETEKKKGQERLYSQIKHSMVKTAMDEKPTSFQDMTSDPHK